MKGRKSVQLEGARVNKSNLLEYVDTVLISNTGPARSQGAIIVHRPARLTHFTYHAPHTVERFLALARSELYPNTEGKLQLRLSPSRAFQEEGKLLAPIVESEVGYTSVDSTGETLEDWWKREILDKWLTPEEDVWAIKIFVSDIPTISMTIADINTNQQDTILVKDGMDLTKQPEKWDLSALKGIDLDDDDDDGQETWSIPPKSLSAGLAQISKTLLHIDPRKASEGILLHVIHDPVTDLKKEWLRWNAEHSFTHFLNEVLYKIDGDTIAIYPGDYVYHPPPPPIPHPLGSPHIPNTPNRKKPATPRAPS